MNGKIFISYRRATDHWAVNRLCEELIGAFGKGNVFLDRQTIPSGSDWDSAIDAEIRAAAAVVVVFSKEWYGLVDVAGATPGRPTVRRIDDPNDKLRRELEMAAKHGRHVFPVIVDSSPEPRPEELPESVRFICKRQFLRLDVHGDAERQIDRLIRDIRAATETRDWQQRLIGQALWLGLLAFAVVVAWHALGGHDNFRNAFARAAFALRDRLVVAETPIAVVELDDTEYRELFGGRSPIDPELMATALRRLRTAAPAKDMCGRTLPLVLNLSLAPSSEDETGAQAALTAELAAWAKCRPVVLACPSEVRRGARAWYQMRWMTEVLAQIERDGNGSHPLTFATGMADPEGLRRANGRNEIGVVAADLAAGRPPFKNHERPECVCPSSPEIQRQCAHWSPASEWDEDGFAVPLPGSSDVRPGGDGSALASTAPRHVTPVAFGRPAFAASIDGAAPDVNDPGTYSFHDALLHADQLMSHKAVLIGTNRSQTRHAVPGRPRRAFEGVSSTMAHAHLLNGAMNHEPPRGQLLMALFGVFAGCLVAAIMLLGGRELERNAARYAHRGWAYVLFAIGVVAVPVGTLVAAAYQPGSIWWLALVALVALVAAGRALLSCFEIVLSRGMAWRWPTELYREFLHAGNKASPLLRAATFAFEGALIVGCLTIIAVMRSPIF